MLQNLFYAILGTFYTLLNNTDIYLSYFILSYVFLGHNDSVEWGLTVLFHMFWLIKEIDYWLSFIGYQKVKYNEDYKLSLNHNFFKTCM